MNPISVESLLSALSLILTTLASLRAASRLDARIERGGCIGLMDGPPILGPGQYDSKPGHKSLNLIDNDTVSDADNNGQTNADDSISNVSPLWEHCEAFRRAAILGLLFDSCNDSDGLSQFFSSIHREGDNHAPDAEEELAIAAAVEAGLLVPTGGGALSHKVRRTRLYESSPTVSSNPLTELATWFVRELSAPFAAIPAWHGMICSFLREERRKNRQSKWTISNIWKRWTGTFYDFAQCDFDAFISGVVPIPCIDAHRNMTSCRLVRVKAYAPSTFRDLRKKCFRVQESEYAKSILNVMDGAVDANECDNVESDVLNVLSGGKNEIPALSTQDCATISHILHQILQKNRHDKQILQTLPYISFQSNSKGAARAGTFFFFTADGGYMIKTVKKEEAKAFLEMLPHYHRFMSDRKNGRNSLLTRFFGMYSVQFLDQGTAPATKWNGGLYSPTKHQTLQSDRSCSDEERVFLVMNSVFPAEASTFITERFDLKGSTVGRECSLEEQQAKGANAVLKDLNLKREVDADRAKPKLEDSRNKRKRDTYGIHIGRRKKAALMAQLEKDVELLNRCGVLDYSLLVGCADMDKALNVSKLKTMSNAKYITNVIHKVLTWMDSPMPYYGSGMTKVDGGCLSSLRGIRRGKQVTYYMGVIDFLQPWTMKKRLERDLKGLAGYDTRAISCVAPSDYAARFLNFIEEHVT
ncbi:hypothetical protein HJC23_009521 [Cyclotella cryptica]|uniref:PIPK domain-containing protein n=1 Tax=Cyclotella cryptica TaxID=29204 RepID=A0ABD3Q531_9STRA|eukprot:CCRYP_008851-RA/>CCRYP_008851-RA protein AED:0.36 eAED:0.36 QI:0/-1/0/1/-1/1/1/0/697